jgi:hypothetical protein
MQFGVFSNGDLLVAGVLPNTHPPSTQPRVALVKSNGQFQRFLELNGDLQLKESEQTALKEGDPEALRKHFNEGLVTAVQLSMIVGHGRDLVLVRLGQRTPLFSVTPGGEVRAVTPEVPEGYGLHDLKSAGDRWIALYTRPISNDKGVDFQTYALDPSTGKEIGRYSYPKFLGLGLACSDGLEFRFLTRDQNKLEVVTLLARPLATQAKPK